MSAFPRTAPGPFRADQLHPGDRYELSEGHPIYREPTGGDGARHTATGAGVLETDPDVDEAGIGPGYSPDPKHLRAPDIAVGNVPDKPGWIQGAPPLAVEYAGSGQDEKELQKKISELVEAGTQWIWVVRLIGPRRVEVHERGKAMRTLGPGDALLAPGVLRNPVPVEALFDRAAAHRATLRNLLQRQGYQDIEAVLAEGEAKGKMEGLRAAVQDLCELLGIPITPERRAAIAAMQAPELDALRARLKRDRRWD